MSAEAHGLRRDRAGGWPQLPDLAGLPVLSIERAPQPVSPLVTEADPEVPGVIHNSHAVFLRGIRAMPWFSDLELGRHGVEMIHPELNLLEIGSS